MASALSPRKQAELDREIDELMDSFRKCWKPEREEPSIKLHVCNTTPQSACWLCNLIIYTTQRAVVVFDDDDSPTFRPGIFHYESNSVIRSSNKSCGQSSGTGTRPKTRDSSVLWTLPKTSQNFETGTRPKDSQFSTTGTRSRAAQSTNQSPSLVSSYSNESLLFSSPTRQPADLVTYPSQLDYAMLEDDADDSTLRPAEFHYESNSAIKSSNRSCGQSSGTVTRPETRDSSVPWILPKPSQNFETGTRPTANKFSTTGTRPKTSGITYTGTCPKSSGILFSCTGKRHKTSQISCTGTRPKTSQIYCTGTCPDTSRNSDNSTSFYDIPLLPTLSDDITDNGIKEAFRNEMIDITRKTYILYLRSLNTRAQSKEGKCMRQQAHSFYMSMKEARKS